MLETVLPFIYYSQNKTGGFTEQFRINSYQDNHYERPKQTQSKGGNNAETATQAAANTKVDYTWENGMLKTKTIGTGTNQLTWTFTNDFNKRWITEKKDENGLKMSFAYDGFRRLIKTIDRYNTSNTDDPQATMQYVYQYKNPNDPNSYNYVGTTATYKGVSIPLSTKQYLDGLGRPMEVVKENYTPVTTSHGIWHQKTFVGYDVVGRQEKVSLPFERDNAAFEVPPAFIASYTIMEYEPSPLSRPVKQYNVDNTVVMTSYGTNIATEVRKCVATNGNGATVTATTNYPEKTLYKITVTDENGKNTCVFKDKLGRVILTRKFLNNQPIDTYNVYDDYGQLVAVLPPGSIDASGNIVNRDGSISSSLTFQYKYDDLYRLTEKKVPGADAQKFYYDDRDLLTLSQDGNMRNPNYSNNVNDR